MAIYKTSYQSIDTPYHEFDQQQEALSSDTVFKLLVLIGLFYLVWNDSWFQNNNTMHAQVEKLETNKNVSIHAAQEEKTKRKLVGVVLPKTAKSHTAFYIDPYFMERHAFSPAEKEEAEKACLSYINQYKKVAIAEMHKFGIPASITLAQGLLESNAGQSRLASATNNHFGIKCFSNNCKKGHCKNFSDDTHKDFFRTYQSVWESYRAHSYFLKKGKRYRGLFDLGSDNYKGWAVGLKKAGYATDPKYAHKLVALIQNLHLDQYDQ